MKRITVKVTPGAKQNCVMGWEGEILKVRVTAAAEKGAANHAVVSLLADFFNIPKRDVVLVHGATARLKLFEIPSNS
ncbi:MAG: DUF167 domain-containing protein [Verrucomicrobia bacterium]|nr:DUF167 domain-containing protein [Verrucomicrobiota bacterium]MBS0646626.1 DUF167 domain-containing protein [Verrucomicrobiota bacterium]